ncbi:MAG TPA: hypothetical protein VF340_05730 [Methyloceanibacter sp.]
MGNPLVKKDLVDAILELREDVERQLKANKYYIALHKLDELLAAIRPLEIIEATVEPAPTPAIEVAPAPETLVEEVTSFHGVVEQPVGDGSFAQHEASA